MQLFSSLAPTEESVPCSLYPKYLREAKNPRKSMKMRCYCQLAFATARLPCIQIRLPGAGRTGKDWFQAQLSFVTKSGHSICFLRGCAPSLFTSARPKRKELLNCKDRNSEPLVLLCTQHSAQQTFGGYQILTTLTNQGELNYREQTDAGSGAHGPAVF